VGKNKILIKFIIILLGFSNLSAQEAALEVLERVRENAFSLENVYYKFEISSKFENNILPISGEFYIKQGSYFIDTNEVDQLYDGERFYTIIHENKEIIISTENTSFFNFSPNQIFNYFLKGFDLKKQNISDDFDLILAESKEDKIIYNLFINSNLSIEKIEMIEKETGEEINRFLTLTYDYNLILPLSLFKFDMQFYKDYIIVTEN
jgi:outer membrane lipoprotein-sorting protein|tara:strand:- start:2679 stop:3299 length:621 start_codon:yes stop_codon:yes gene_type:complete